MRAVFIRFWLISLAYGESALWGKSPVEVWGHYLFNFGFGFDFCVTVTKDHSIGHQKAGVLLGLLFFDFFLILPENTLRGICS